jgi:hypothetical protein
MFAMRANGTTTTDAVPLVLGIARLSLSCRRHPRVVIGPPMPLGSHPAAWV